MAGCALIDDRHFASIPLSQIMDVGVAFRAFEAILNTVYTPYVFLRFRLMAGSTIYLRRYVDFFRMLFSIYNIDMTAATRIGAMRRVCKFRRINLICVTFQTIGGKNGSLHIYVDCNRSEFSKRR